MKRYIILLLVSLLAAYAMGQAPLVTVYDTSNSPIHSNFIKSLVIDDNGTKWMVTDSGVASLSGSTWKLYDSIDFCFTGGQWVFKICNGINGDIWLGTGCGLWKYDGALWTPYDTANSDLLDNDVLGLAVAPDGTVWVSSYKGVQSFDGTNWMLYDTSNSALPYFSHFKSIAIDNSGNVWVGGKYRFDGTDWTTFYPPYGDVYGYVTDVAFGPDNTIWEGTEDQSWMPGPTGFQSYDGQSWTTYNTWDSGMPSDQVVCVEAETSGAIWIGTWGGLARFNDHLWTVLNTSNTGLPSNFIYDIAIDTAGLKWVATYNGLAVLDDSSFPYSVSDMTGAENNILVYPNPASDVLNIQFKHPVETARVDIYDIHGSIVMSRETKSQAMLLNLSPLARGCYFLKVVDKAQVTVKKIVIE